MAAQEEDKGNGKAETAAASEAFLFLEETEAFQCIDHLDAPFTRDDALRRLREVFDKYWNVLPF